MHSSIFRFRSNPAPATRRRLALSGFLALALSIQAIQVCPAADANSVSVQYRDGRLSVKARQVPLRDLLRIVGDEAGFEVTAYGNLAGQSVSASFSGLKVQEAVRRLLRNTNAIVTYDKDGGPAGEPVISKIFLLGAGTGEASPVRIETVEPGLDNAARVDEIESGDASSRIAAIERAEGLSDEITQDNLAFSLQHDPDPAVRMRAVAAIREVGGTAAVDMLESGLGDENPEVRKKVVETLGNFDDERIPLWLGQVLMGDPEPSVRLEAVKAIARKGGDVARTFLQAATGDSSNLVSEAARRLAE